MITPEQITTLKVGDKVTVTMQTYKRKKPTVISQVVTAINPPDFPGKILVADRVDRPILTSVYSMTDDRLSIPTE